MNWDIRQFYWPGNVLWQGGRISAVVDWEEAGCGDQAIDVAYCRMAMLLDGLVEAADEFLGVYEAERGTPVLNLAFWELAVAARAMHNPEGWEIADSPRRDRFAAFLERALRHPSLVIRVVTARRACPSKPLSVRQTP